MFECVTCSPFDRLAWAVGAATLVTFLVASTAYLIHYYLDERRHQDIDD